MLECQECGNEELAGSLFCSNCGADLLELGGEVAVMERPRKPKPPSLVGQNFDSIDDKKNIILMIPYSGRAATFPVSAEISIGRADEENTHPPKLNLFHDAGSEHGVSRQHATIRPDDQGRGLVIIDENSTNGTKLNHFQLPPELPYPLKSGDELQFGDLLVHVFLK